MTFASNGFLQMLDEMGDVLQMPTQNCQRIHLPSPSIFPVSFNAPLRDKHIRSVSEVKWKHCPIYDIYL